MMIRFVYNEPARSNTVGSFGCFSTQRWQHLTCHLLQCAASVWSTASTSRPTIATHVSAKPNRTAWKHVTYMGAVYWLHSLCRVLQHIVPCFKYLNMCGLHALVLSQWDWVLTYCTNFLWVLVGFSVLFCFLFLWSVSSPKVLCILATSAATSDTNEFSNCSAFCCLFLAFWSLNPFCCSFPKDTKPKFNNHKSKKASSFHEFARSTNDAWDIDDEDEEDFLPSGLHSTSTQIQVSARHDFINEHVCALSWSLMKGDILMCFHLATAESAWWHRNWDVTQTGTSQDRSSKLAGGGHRVRACQRQSRQVE